MSKNKFIATLPAGLNQEEAHQPATFGLSAHQLAQIFKAAAEYGLAIWDHRPAVMKDRDPFDYVPGWVREIEVGQDHLAHALHRPEWTEPGWHEALKSTACSAAIRAALCQLYGAIE